MQLKKIPHNYFLIKSDVEKQIKNIEKVLSTKIKEKINFSIFFL